MKFIRRKKSGGNKISGWQTEKDGFEKTLSPEMIDEALNRLATERVWVSIASEEYQSGITLLNDFNSTKLHIDKPEGWPNNLEKVRIIFKDAKKLWNHFDVNVAAITGNEIHTTYPMVLFRLQRRDHYRMIVPRGSMASFVAEGRKHEDFFANDFSAGGVMLCTKGRPNLKAGDIISDIAIVMPAVYVDGELQTEEHIFQISLGRVMHVYQNEQTEFLRFGISFMINKQIEDDIVKYIRERELEMLRKWL